MRMHCCIPTFLALLLAADVGLAKTPAGPSAPVGPPRAAGPVHYAGPGPVRHAGPPAYHEQYVEHGPGPDIGLSGNCCADGCGDCCQQDCCNNHQFCVAAGYAFVFLKPHFENDVAYTTTIDQGNLASVVDRSFDYDLELSPRVWLEICKPTQLGFRATYWQFDHGAPTETGVQTDTTGESISLPIDILDIDISTAVEGDFLRADTELNMETFDLEGTKWTDFCSWQFGTTAGLRYASIEQGYKAYLFNEDEVLQDSFESNHRFDGVGPTFSVEARRPMGCITWFSMARGSLLYGNGKFGTTTFQQLTPTAIGLTAVTSAERNDVLTVAELQLGVEWCRTYCNGKRFFCRTALEGQIWQGVGGPLTEDGDLGLFGFHTALGMTL